MNRRAYREIAKRHNVSVVEVKREMQEAICTAYWNPERKLIHIKAQNAVPHKGEIPTPDEMICHIVNEVRKKKKEHDQR